MKRLIFFVIAAMMLMASCSVSSPSSAYASGMQPTIEKLKNWQAVNAELEGLLTDGTQSSTGVPRIQMIELYNLATEYKITRDDYVSMGFQPLDFLVGDAHKITQQGHDILDALSKVTPVQETEAAHQSVAKCIEARVALAEELESSLKELTPVDLSLYDNSSVCASFDADLEKLTTYMNANK
jgi:hypothetical protein